jgi:Endonuclease/Exonuclease/phosphatase family
MIRRSLLKFLFSATVLGLAPGLPSSSQAQTLELTPAKAADAIRVATFNVSLNRTGPTRLTQDLQQGDDQIKMVAAIIRAVKPDILLLNEIDYSTAADNAGLFEQKYLADTAPDLLLGAAWSMPHRFTAPVNTGEPSSLDLNKNGRIDDPEDAWGFGRFPGQYGMAVLSRFEIDQQATRTFQHLLWSKLEGAIRPVDPDSGQPYYDEATWQKLRLPSKSLWDVVIKLPNSPNQASSSIQYLHLLACHPTPPAFDGPEDRNGCRNQDEIRLLLDYINPSDSDAEYWIDDQGRKGKQNANQSFVIAGDLNSDPVDGGNRSQVINQLLANPRVQASPVPASEGGVRAAEEQAQKNLQHRGKPDFDTADFNDQVVGNLRVDYVLPSSQLTVKGGGVVWPSSQQQAVQSDLVKLINAASDHHLVWIDVARP